jgi:ribonuclease BN (tRNA processing enzyme)
MKLTILGSGTVVPDGDRNSAGYIVDAPGVRLMMDCGAGAVHALARYDTGWEAMTHLFISHFHVDHAGELASLFFAFKYGMRKERSEPLTIIGPKGTDRVMEGLKMAFGENLFEPKFPVSLRMVSPGERVQLANECSLCVAKTPHTEESLAVRVESRGRAICYTGDTDASNELPIFFSRADLLVSECSFRERREGVPHVSIKDVATMAREAGVARLAVTHFYFEVNESELRKEIEAIYSGEVIIGRDGMMIEV